MADAKPGQYYKAARGVETITRPVEAFHCAVCEFWSTDEDVVKEHVRNPGLHPKGTPKLLKDDPDPVESASDAPLPGPEGTVEIDIKEPKPSSRSGR